MSEVKLPEKWKEWEILNVIGSGSYGTVYKVQRQIGEETFISALKVIQVPRNQSVLDEARSAMPEESSLHTYFEKMVQASIREIKLMDHLKGNSNIVSVQDFCVEEKQGEIGWTIYILMEYLQSLTSCLSKAKLRKLPEDEIIRIGIDICAALEDCAKYHIIHRDIKPDNIFKSALGKYKLGDFGVARELDQNASTMAGTFSYMAPEVFLHKKYGASADVYSLGLMLYRLGNNNRDPFVNPYKQILTNEEREQALSRRMKGEELPRPAELSAGMTEILKKACAYKPEDRYQSAAEMKKALETFFGLTSDTAKRFTQSQNPVAQEQYRENQKKRVAESGKGWEEAWEKVWKEGPESTEPEKSKGDALQDTVSEDNLPQKKKKSAIWKGFLVLIAVLAIGAFFMYRSGYLVIEKESSSSTQTAAVVETTEEITATESAEPDITPETTAAETTAAETAAVEEAESTEETAGVGTVVEKTYVVTGSTLNVREQASTDSEKLATLSQGTVCQGTGNVSEDGAWIEIYFNDQNAIGWVSAQYVQEQTAAAESTDETAADGISNMSAENAAVYAAHKDTIDSEISDFVEEQNRNTFYLNVGEEAKPGAAIWQNISCYSSNENVVTVTQGGKVTAVGSGEAIVVVIASTGLVDSVKYIVY